MELGSGWRVTILSGTMPRSQSFLTTRKRLKLAVNHNTHNHASKYDDQLVNVNLYK